MIKMISLFLGCALLSVATAYLLGTHLWTPFKKSALFPPIAAYHEGYLKVSSMHEIWYAEYGNPQGIPVVVLHGGPGGGCGDNDMRYFDPKRWRIILLDQRGAKRSKPFAEMQENNTQNLIADIEKLRNMLKINRWVVFGGSWGSTLAIAYGEAHPEPVLGFILRGIFLGRKSEDEQFWYGMKDTFPDTWQELSDFLPENQRKDLMSAYHALIMNPDLRVAMPAARAFTKYDVIGSFLKITPKQLQTYLSDDHMVLGVSKTFIHYSFNHFFLKENELMDNLTKINHLPLIIVHGRYDTVTRANVAYELHQHWPKSTLFLVEESGHSALEPHMTSKLVDATNLMSKRVLKAK